MSKEKDGAFYCANSHHFWVTRDGEEGLFCNLCPATWSAHHIYAGETIQGAKQEVSHVANPASDRLPECPHYVAHPQSVWFNEHWRPIFERLRQSRTDWFDECQDLKDENKRLREALERIAKYNNGRDQWSSDIAADTLKAAGDQERKCQK